MILFSLLIPFPLQATQGTIRINLSDDSWSELHAEIVGPAETPYKDGRFQLEIKIPDEYPFVPPKVR